jgi:integrase
LEPAKPERLHALYVLALCLGLRRGELLGLRWQDADLDNGTLEVVQTLQRASGARMFGGSTTRRLPCQVERPGLAGAA